ncbi:hypothetical protein JW898_02615 [Candidatus Woesearchaeota archaeon]|nr:hypothetical protein [Candidatus Woesearchaeota archaeon]
MIELEKTYLAKSVPKGLAECRSKEIIDIYIPRSHLHPKLRIRKNGDRYEMTKKEPVADDASEQEEQTIILTEEEFNALNKLDGKKTRKIRYHYPHDGRMAEIDVFEGALKGLIVIDFEFDTEEDKETFAMPEFCLAEVTQEEFIAGGMVCGRKYEDLKKDLRRYNYKKLFLD